ncbi:MAG: HAMP domain-containing protein [Gammaproteobacteria bacterium]|nr:HAMP domain-containing protein [Gammaproteobacteria bacterium]
MLHARWRYRLATASLRSRLLVVLSLGMTLMALTAALTTGWLSSRQTSDLMEALALKLTASFAEQSVLGLLYDSPENLAEPLKSIMAFPAVRGARVVRKNGEILAERGEPAQREALAEGQVEARLVVEDEAAWTFSAPVYSGLPPSGGEASAEMQLPRATPELLGYVVLRLGKGSLKDLERGVLLTNVGVSLVFALVFLLALNVKVRQATAPLQRLSQLMRKAGRMERHIQVDTAGPREIKRLAQAFNRMMADIGERDRRLNAHKEELESTVALRTAELVHARDVALSASRQKSEFLANMSHELRTPLQAIIGYSDIVRESLHLECMDQECADMDTVVTNAQHLLGLINNILDMAKLEAGRAAVAHQVVELDSLVREATDTIRPLASRGGNALSVDMSGLKQTRVHSDRQKLLQILLNLLSNAAKFTQNGEITVRVASHSDGFSLSVRDTGIGIPGDQQEAIFDEFHQVDGSATRAFQGTGLGLTLCRRFAQLLGGRISVHSTLGLGSEFRVELPLNGPEPA